MKRRPHLGFLRVETISVASAGFHWGTAATASSKELFNRHPEWLQEAAGGYACVRDSGQCVFTVLHKLEPTALVAQEGSPL